VVTIQILHVPGCPGAHALEEGLDSMLACRPDMEVNWRVVTTEDDAQRLGMTGSPTILADGADPFAAPGLTASLSCRVYPDEDGNLRPAPTARQVQQVLGLTPQ
jgi:hypothetical protein